MKKNALEKEFHMMSRDVLQKQFEVDFSKGLSSEKAASLLKKHGQNIIKISYTHLYKAFFLDFVDIFSILLWITMILAILAYTPTGNPPSVAFLITASTMFVTLIAKASLHAYQAFNSLKSMSHIQNDKESKCRVLRDGEAKFIGCCDLTLGDLIYLERNQRVPADLRIIEAKGIKLM
jgi:magnesium-transporting ATPase (P-type)